MAIKSLLLSMTLMFGLIGCNTMEGAGEDLESGGEAIQEEARD
ncbi:MAG TPA: entericidin A/B family lipoprotein [Pseudomonas xinjiangensis]|uniref:Entericidin A/B family lipoprotein n=1 Tax=Halopseudomonas xinjiangensis TaxID=487184 RepID=A0A7V1FSR3_9GAMM|nr:entericidin A/B family lipoprotein [Halopseudomonas xinjiangensis]HEC48372.1 entericidin A/B family lipoprotein [Halopseudomonas xinjiangensis]